MKLPCIKAVNLHKNRPYTQSLYTVVPIEVGIHSTVTTRSPKARFTRKYRFDFFALSADIDTMISRFPNNPIINIGMYSVRSTTVENWLTVNRLSSNSCRISSAPVKLNSVTFLWFSKKYL